MRLFIVIAAAVGLLLGVPAAQAHEPPDWLADVEEDGGPPEWIDEVKSAGGPPAWVETGAGGNDQDTTTIERAESANVPEWVETVRQTGGPPAWVEGVKANGGPPAWVESHRGAPQALAAGPTARKTGR